MIYLFYMINWGKKSNVPANVPTSLIIFGGTGDLSEKKLFPSLYDLYIKDLLPLKFSIIGFSRQELSHEKYRQFGRDAIIGKYHKYSPEKLDSFLENIYYQHGLFDKRETYSKLALYLETLDKKIGMCSNKLFHLAVPPIFYDAIFDNLSHSGLTKPCGEEDEWTPLEGSRSPATAVASPAGRPLTGWTRILVEKPFGSDLKTARDLDQKLGLLFKEDQIFRIDHYLAKDAIQNILAFRFSNVLFEDSWNNNHVEKVHIKLFENIGVEGRGAYYDSIGAFRDVGQNHMLQMLALIAMESPYKLTAQTLREKREKIFKDLRIFSHDDSLKHSVRGQYEGYTDVLSVAENSQTETYFMVKAFIDNDRWRGVPFYLESGKELSERQSEIIVYFKSAAPCVCGTDEEHEHQNILTLEIQPTQGISMRFWIKKPGIIYELEPKILSFEYETEENDEESPDAYEKVLFDCIQGDQTLFVSTEEVEAAWEFITPFTEAWQGIPPQRYVKGSNGPNKKLM